MLFRSGIVDVNGHDLVDLGLPSGTLWATMNVGASSPEENGNYYAWAETEVKESYDWNNYHYCNGTYNTVNKYTHWSDYFTRGGVRADNYTTIRTTDDAASVNWGGVWRIPSYGEWEEIISSSYCIWTWKTLNGIDGYEVKSKSNGSTIFLPHSGYWSSSLNLKYCYKAWGFSVDENYYKSNDGYHRCQGLSVRPVCHP